MHIDNENEERRLLNLRDASIQEVLPQYFAARYPKFVSLLQRYYEYEDDSSSPSILLKHLFATRDINQTDITLLSYIEDELLLGNNWAFGLPDVRAAANFSNTLFRTKGTKYSIEWFFRSFFDLDPEIFYPKQDIFDVGESILGPASNKFLTDDKLYQTFAINIKSALPVSEWFDLYKLFVHPAGMYLGNTTLVVGENDEVLIQTDSAEAEITTRPSPTFTMTPYIRGIQTDSAGESDRVYLQITSTDALDQYYFWYIKRTTTDSDDFVFPAGEEQPTIRYREPVLVLNDSGQMYVDINWQLDIEGPEQFRVYLQEEKDSGNSNDEILATQVITINDKFYTVVGTGTSGYEFTSNGVDEGATLNVRISGQNIPDADSVGHPRAPLFFIEHITTENADFVGTPPVGIGNAVPITITNGVGNTSLQLSADNTTEGSEFFKMRLFDKQGRNLTGYYPDDGIEVKVFDTSKTPLAVTEIVASPSAFLDEGIRVGDVFGATINAENVHPFRDDSSVFVEISFNTASAADFASPIPGVSGEPRLPATLVSVDGGITATVFIDSVATIAADAVSDDLESFNIDVYDELTGGNLLLRRSVIINDVGVTITPSSTSPTEGDTVTFDIEITGTPADGATGSLWIELAHGTTTDADFTTTPPTATNGRVEVTYNTANTPSAQYSIDLQISDGDDDNETFSIHAYNYQTSGINLASSGTITIQDLPPAYALELYASAADRTAETPTTTTFTEGDIIYGKVIVTQGAENETVTIDFFNAGADARFTDTTSFVNTAIQSYDFELQIGDNTILGQTTPIGLQVRAQSPRNQIGQAITVLEDDIQPSYTLELFSDAGRTTSTTDFTEGDTIYGNLTTFGTAQGETVTINFQNGDARTTDSTTIINTASGTYPFTLTLGSDFPAINGSPAGCNVRAESVWNFDTYNVFILDIQPPSYTVALYSDAGRTTSTTTFTEGDTIYGHLTTAGVSQNETVNITIINGDDRTTATDTVTNTTPGTYTFELLLGNDPLFNVDPSSSVRASSTYDTEDTAITINNEAAAITGITGPTTITDGGSGINLSIDPINVASLLVNELGGTARAEFTLESTGDFTTFYQTGVGGESPAIGADNWAPSASQGAGFGDDYQVRVLSYDSTSYTFGAGTLNNSVPFTVSVSASNNVGSQTWSNNSSHWYRLDADFAMQLSSGTISAGSEDGNRRMIDIEIKEFDGSNYGSGTTLLTHRLQLSADVNAI